MKNQTIIKEKNRLELYIKLNKILIEEASINTSNLDEIKKIKFNLLWSIYFSLINIQNILKGIKINDSIQNYVDSNVVANNCRALIERVALYNYLFNHDNQELIKFLISAHKYDSLKRIKLDERNINERIQLEKYKQMELEVLQEYCTREGLNYSNLTSIINGYKFTGFLEITQANFKGIGYKNIVENCTSNEYFKNLYHFLSNKTHPSFVSITTLKSSINKSDYLEKSYQYVSETLFYVNYVFYLFEEEFNVEKEMHSQLSNEEKDLIYDDLKFFMKN